MSEKQRQILTQLKAAIEARKASIRVRIIDRAFAQIAVACVLVAFCGSTEARTITKPVGFWVKQGNHTTVVLYAPPVRQTIVYQNNVSVQPAACRPESWKPAKPAYQPSRFTPPN